MAVNVESKVARDRIPAHIDPAHVIDYNVYAGYRFDEIGDLHQGLFRMGEELGRGIFWTPHNGGHWFINDHELLFQAVRKPDLFSSGKMTIPPMPEELEPRFIPLSLDPPEHAPFRMPLMKAFAPDAIREMEAGIRSLARGLIETVVPKGACEFIDAVGEPLPVTVFMTMMGMPLDRMAEFREWMFDMASDDNDRRANSYVRVTGAMGELVKEREAAREDDLLSRLMDADIDGRPPSFAEMQNYGMLLFTAGLDTLVNSFTFGVYQLAVDPELQRRVKADRSRIPDLIEELLRRYGIAMPPRVVTRDAEFGGVQLKAGERIVMMLPAGNLDPQSFDDPLRFDIDRGEEPHLTFNSGPHRCVGSHLARLELRVFFEEWFELMPMIRLDPAQRPKYRPGLNLAIVKLPIIWDVQ
jgi:cytochrome P450